jgi:glycosyltransferase involved in cell wall biosynthesis
LVASAEDPQGLANCIGYVLGLGDQERRELGQRQRRRMESEFDIESIWVKYRDLYGSM